MSDASKKILQVLSSIPSKWVPPELTDDMSILEVGLACVLTRQLTPAQADKTLAALRGAYGDWNELRVSQVQEYRLHVKTRSAKTQVEVARDVKTYLQEVFQKNHGFDLEFLRKDFNEAGKFLQQLEFLGGEAGHYLLYHACGKRLPTTTGTIRVLDRLGLAKRTSSPRKAQEALESKIPAAKYPEFGIRLGLVVQEWCDAKKPSCWACPLVDGCPHGKKVRSDWEVQQKRLEAQRKKEEERRKKEEEKARKRAEAEARRKAKELAKRKEQELKKRKQEEAKRQREEERKRKAAERVAREAQRKKELQARQKAAAKKKLADAKKAATKKKVLAKKAAAKKAAAKKAAAKKAAAKKAAAKKAASKKKKAATSKGRKKAPAKKAPASKTRKKATAKKAGKTTKKAGARKATKKATKKKTGAKKTTKKKVTKAKAKKKTAKKTAKRRR